MNDSANSSLEALVLGIPYVILCFIFLPLYFMVIWVLSVNPIFEGSIFYRILKHMAVANAMSLNSTFMGGLFELSQSTFSDFISITSGSLSSWFKVAICLLHILLSINRFSVVFGFHIPFENDIHQYSIFLMWYALAVLLIMTPYLKLEFEYQLDRHWFKEPSELLEKPIDYARHVVSFIYIIVILKYFCSKRPPPENTEETEFSLRGFSQCLALLIPHEVSSILQDLYKAKPNSSPWVQIALVLSYRSSPALVIVTVLYLNRDLRKSLLELPHKAKKRFCGY